MRLTFSPEAYTVLAGLYAFRRRGGVEQEPRALRTWGPVQYEMLSDSELLARLDGVRRARLRGSRFGLCCVCDFEILRGSRESNSSVPTGSCYERGVDAHKCRRRADAWK